MARMPAPVISAEMSAWVRLGGRNSGICGDPNHRYGYHLPANELSASDYSRRRDPQGSDGPYTSWSYCCAGDFWHGGRSTLRARHATVLKGLMSGRFPMIAEFIGQPYSGRPVYYWFRGDGRTRLARYTGSGHDTWSHIAWYRSRAGQRAYLWTPPAPAAPPVPKYKPTYIPQANTYTILNKLGYISPEHAARPKLMRVQAVMKAAFGWGGAVHGTFDTATRQGIVSIQRSLRKKYGGSVVVDGRLNVSPDLYLVMTGFRSPQLAYLRYGTYLPYQVKRAQALLNLFRGNLKVDGVYGSSTVAAAKRFQKSMGLPITGKIDTDDWAILIAGYRWNG